MTEYSTSFIPRKVLIYKCSNYKGDQITEIIFDKFTGILGETGAGKSSVIDAITFPIWKTTPRLKGTGVKIEDFCDVGGFCEVEFEKNGNLYKVRRGRNSSGSFVVLTVNGERYPETKPSILDSKIQDIVGIEYESFAMTGYIPQDEVKEIILKTPSERLELFKKIFKLDIFDDALDITRKRLKEFEKETSHVEGEITAKESFIEGGSNIKSQIKEEKIKIPPISKKIKKNKLKVEKIREEVKTLEKDEKDHNRLSALLESHLNAKEECSSAIVSLETDLHDLKDDLLNIEEEDVEELENKIKIREECEKLKIVYDSSVNKYNEMREKYLQKKEEINLKSKEFDIGGLELLEKFREDASIQPSYVYEVIESEVISNIYQNISNEFIEESKPIKEEIKSLRSKLKKMKNEVPESKEELKKRIEENSSKKDRKLQISTRIREIEKQIEKQKNKIIEIQDKESTIKEEIEKLSSAHEKYEESTQIIEVIQEKIMDLSGRKQSILGELKQIQKRAKEIEVMKKDLEKLKERHVKMIEHQTVLEIIKQNVFHKKGLAMFTLQSILSEIEFKASEIATTLTYHREPAFKEDGMPNRIQKISLIPIKGRSGGIEIEVDGINARRFSGGEKTIISMSIRLALSQQLMEMSSLASSLRVLIIDEGDLGSLDDLTLEAFIHLLHSFEDFFDTIILITHIEGATDGFNHVIKIEKDNDTGYSSIVS